MSEDEMRRRINDLYGALLTVYLKTVEKRKGK